MLLNDYINYVKYFSIRQIQKYASNEPDGYLLHITCQNRKDVYQIAGPRPQPPEIIIHMLCYEPDGLPLALNLSELKRCVSNSWPQTPAPRNHNSYVVL